MASDASIQKNSKELMDRFIDSFVEADCDNYRASIFVEACRSQSSEVVAQLINNYDANNINYKSAIRAGLNSAVLGGRDDIVKILIPIANIKDSDSEALYLAVNNNHTNIVNLLIPHSDPTAGYSRCLRAAVANDNIEILKLLLPHSDVNLNGQDALFKAMDSNNFNIIDILLESITNETILGEALLKSTRAFNVDMTRVLIENMSDANYKDSMALANIVTTVLREYDIYYQSAVDIVDLLFDKSDLDTIKNYCYNPDLPVAKYFLERYENFKTKNILEQHITTEGKLHRSKRTI